MFEVLFPRLLIFSILLCSLSVGVVFTFFLIAMPGIKSLSDREFIRAFQAMDSIIQKNNPLFVLVWAGSIVTLLVSTAIGITLLDGLSFTLLAFSTALYIFGFQLPTILINVPLNNQLQMQDVKIMTDIESRCARQAFEDSGVFQVSCHH